jgi:iron complex outermembrane receptor protein
VKRGYSLLLALVSSLVMQLPVLSAAQFQPSAVSDERLLFQEIPSVIGASKYEQKVTEAPSAVSIITASDIRKYGYRTLADVLRSVRSFYVTYDRNYSYVGVRGFGRPHDYNTRILLLVDGHRMNDTPYDQALVGTEAVLDVDLIDRIEVIRGPGSSLYGSNAFFAVVNIITKSGHTFDGAEMSGEAGSFDAFKGRATYGDRFGNGAELMLSVSAYEQKGDRLYYPEFDPLLSAATNSRATNGGVAEHADYDRYQSAFIKAAVDDLTVEGGYVSRIKGIPTGAFETDFNAPGNRTKDDTAFVDARFERTIGGMADVAIRVFYDHRRYEGDYLYNVLYASGVNKDQGFGERWGTELRGTFRVGDVHRLILGAEYQGVRRMDQRNFDVNGGVVYLEDQRRSRNSAAYILDEMTLRSSILLNIGVRHDDYAAFDGTTSPRVAVIYTPTDLNAFKVLYGTAFRNPNAFELYFTSSTNDPNPALKPEKIRTTEVVYEHYWKERFWSALSAYHYRINDLISQSETAPGVTRYENLDEVVAHGIELALDNRWASGLEGRFSYAVQRTEDRASGQPITNSPAHLVKLNLAMSFFADRFIAAVEEHYTGRRRTEQGNMAGAYYLTNLTLTGRTRDDRCSLSASVYNLLDKQYGDPVSKDFLQDTIEQDGRTFRVKLVYAF